MARPPARAAAPLLAALPLAATLAACAPAPGRPAPRRATLAAVADSLARTPPLHRAQWGVLVRDAATGRTLYERNADRLFVPASNTKLVVTAVALAEFGPDYRYRTELYAPRRAPDDTVARALLVVGRGDPTLSRRFHPEGPHPLDALADSVAGAGIRRIAGPLVVDASGPAIQIGRASCRERV